MVIKNYVDYRNLLSILNYLHDLNYLTFSVISKLKKECENKLKKMKK